MSKKDSKKENKEDVFHGNESFRLGWECPRCGRILNPKVKVCDCTGDLKFSFDEMDLIK